VSKLLTLASGNAIGVVGLSAESLLVKEVSVARPKSPILTLGWLPAQSRKMFAGWVRAGCHISLFHAC